MRETLTLTPANGQPCIMTPHSRTYERVRLPCGTLSLMHLEPAPTVCPGGPLKVTASRAGISTPLGTWKVQRHTRDRLTIQYLHP